jgi:hypothetical protein
VLIVSGRCWLAAALAAAVLIATSSAPTGVAVSAAVDEWPQSIGSHASAANRTAALSSLVVDAVTKRPVADAVVSPGDLDDRRNIQARRGGHEE